MSLVTLKEVLENARSKKCAVGNFDVFNLEMLRGVMEAAEESRSPVILAYAEPFEAFADIRHYAKLLLSYAEQASVPVVLHSDHSVSLEEIQRVLDNGFTSVMIDASDKSFEENVEITRKVVEMARPYGASVESEIGHVSGLNTLFENDCNVFTDPQSDKKFAEETEIDALAVSIGNVHGVYQKAPDIQFGLLEELNTTVPIPLVLHGASGICDEDMVQMVKGGIAKVNYYTDLCLAASECMKQQEGKHYLDTSQKIVEAIKKVVLEKMLLLKES